MLLAAWGSELAGLCTRTVSCSSQGRSVACAEQLTVWQAGGGVADRLATAVDYDASCEPNSRRHHRLNFVVLSGTGLPASYS
jgi:hypothetical protein